MVSIDIGNITETVQFSDFTIDVDLLDLASIYDAGLIKFIYGQQSDLSDGTTLSQAMFATGSTSQLIDGLTEGTQYYYKVVADTVSYNSSSSMANCVSEEGFMEDLSVNAMEMGKIANSSIAMTEIANSSIAMTEVGNTRESANALFGTQNIELLYSSTYNENFLNGFWNTQSGDITIGSNYIYVYNNNDNPSYIQSELDLSEKNTLYIDWEDISEGTDGGYESYLKINGTTIGTKVKDGTTRSIDNFDISSYGANSIVEIINSTAGANTEFDVGVAVYNLYAE